MNTIRINKKKLYQTLLEVAISDENYESAAKIRDAIAVMSDDAFIDVEEVMIDDDGNKINDDNVLN